MTQLWLDVESKEAPKGATPIVDLACCGYCYTDTIECIRPLLQCLLRAAGGGICEHHPSDSYLVCPRCAPPLIEAAERCRETTWLNPLDEESEARDSFRQIRTAGLLSDEFVDQLIEEFDFEEWLTWGGQSYLAKYVEPSLAGKVTVEKLHAMIDELRWDPRRESFGPQPRLDDKGDPPRGAYQRGEMEMAKRMGLPEPPRWMTERVVREAAFWAINEADFVRLAHEKELRLIPYLDPLTGSIRAYSAILTTLPEPVRREYGGKSLARDLTLHRLRQEWSGESESLSGKEAWTTWLNHTAAAIPLGVPEPRGVGTWSWVHPDFIPAPAPVEVPGVMPPTSYRRRTQARRLLIHAQGGWCAMCSIRYRNWRTFRAGLPHEDTVPLGRAEHLDHDHDTGLIRGLLCARCNTILEPGGERTLDPVWLAYVTVTPAAEVGCSWPYE